MTGSAGTTDSGSSPRSTSIAVSASSVRTPFAARHHRQRMESPLWRGSPGAKNDILVVMWKRLLFWFGIVTLPLVVWAQSVPDDPTEILLRVRSRVMETIERLPRYMCTLNTERAEYQLAGIKGSPSCDALLSEKEKGHLQP